jgi:hypothetical protein
MEFGTNLLSSLAFDLISHGKARSIQQWFNIQIVGDQNQFKQRTLIGCEYIVKKVQFLLFEIFGLVISLISRLISRLVNKLISRLVNKLISRLVDKLISRLVISRLVDKFISRLVDKLIATLDITSRFIYVIIYWLNWLLVDFKPL